MAPTPFAKVAGGWNLLACPCSEPVEHLLGEALGKECWPHLEERGSGAQDLYPETSIQHGPNRIWAQLANHQRDQQGDCVAARPLMSSSPELLKKLDNSGQDLEIEAMSQMEMRFWVS